MNTSLDLELKYHKNQVRKVIKNIPQRGYISVQDEDEKGDGNNCFEDLHE